jgi:Tol biopolymer transport system component
MRFHPFAAAIVGVCLAALPAVARADVFNGRIAFSSFRTDPLGRTGDIFTMNADGTDLRQLTDNPADDAQSDWSPDGRDIAYRIRKPGFTINFEVARMTASGEGHERLTFTPDREASSQPSWFPDGSGILFRRSGPGGVSSIWQMGLFGEDPVLRFDPPRGQLYPSWSPDMTKVIFATVMSPTGDTDRAIQTLNPDGTGLTTLYDIPGAFDSAPAWSPDGTKVAFESNADVAGGNPERDMEVWVMNADGTNPIQLTRDAIHDEGPAWSPDGALLAYSSGADDGHVDIKVMTAAGVPVSQLTDYPGRDESPDWEAIPAPDTDRRCGDVAAFGPGVHDVRAAGQGLSCDKALELAQRWAPADRPGNRPGKVEGFDSEVSDYGGTLRVILTHRGNHGGDTGNDKLVAFLYQS